MMYILKHEGKEQTLYKLGFSSNFKARLSSYKGCNPTIEVIKTFDDDEIFNHELELKIHSNFKASYNYEWYDEETIIKIIESLETGSYVHFKSKLPRGYRNSYEDYLVNYDNDVIRNEYESEYPEFADYKKYLTTKEMNTKHWVKERLLELVNDCIELENVLFNFGRKYKLQTLTVAEVNDKLEQEFKSKGIKLKAKSTLLENSDLVNVSKTKINNGDKRVNALKFN